MHICCIIGHVNTKIEASMLRHECPRFICELRKWPNVIATYCMHLAVAEGPNHSPGCLLQDSAPCWTNRCIEKGASG